MTCSTAGSIYSADLGHQKHEAAFFQLATQRLGGDPTDVVFVDDLLHNVEQASSAGWRAVHALPGETWEPTVAEILGLE
jgi:putative hydrolase of the HAD superfamily